MAGLRISECSGRLPRRALLPVPNGSTGQPYFAYLNIDSLNIPVPHRLPPVAQALLPAHPADIGNAFPGSSPKNPLDIPISQRLQRLRQRRAAAPVSTRPVLPIVFHLISLARRQKQIRLHRMLLRIKLEIPPMRRI